MKKKLKAALPSFLMLHQTCVRRAAANSDGKKLKAALPSFLMLYQACIRRAAR